MACAYAEMIMIMIYCIYHPQSNAIHKHGIAVGTAPVVMLYYSIGNGTHTYIVFSK